MPYSFELTIEEGQEIVSVEIFENGKSVKPKDILETTDFTPAGLNKAGIQAVKNFDAKQKSAAAEATARQLRIAAIQSALPSGKVVVDLAAIAQAEADAAQVVQTADEQMAEIST